MHFLSYFEYHKIWILYLREFVHHKGTVQIAQRTLIMEEYGNRVRKAILDSLQLTDPLPPTTGLGMTRKSGFVVRKQQWNEDAIASISGCIRIVMEVLQFDSLDCSVKQNQDYWFVSLVIRFGGRRQLVK
jgi:hypothetical protein